MIALLLATALAGTYDASATPAQVCRPGYTRTERAKDTYELRDGVYRVYGIPRGQRRGYVIDHVLPLELGGLTVEENLRPQRRDEAARKDKDEHRLRRAVCSGRMTLDAARDEMLRRTRWRRRGCSTATVKG